jgi:error-prone DNA polymerase
MPEIEPKARDHPFKAAKAAADAVRAACALDGFTRAAASGDSAGPEYVELLCTSNYTFLTGASHPEELSMQAAALGYRAVGIADTNTLAGVVRAHCGAKDATIPASTDANAKGIRCIVGSRLVLAEPKGLTIAAYPTTRAAYGRLCTLLTRGKRRAEKGQCLLTLDDVAAHADELMAIAIPDGDLREIATGREGEAEGASSDAAERGSRGLDGLARHLGALKEIFDEDRLSLAACVRYGSDDRAHLGAVSRLGARFGVPLVASNDVLYQVASRRPLQDVLTCIRLGTTIERAGLALLANAERHLKPAHEMARLFAHMPEALSRSVTIARRTEGFSLDQLRYEYPDEVCPAGVPAATYLRELTVAGAKDRYPKGVPSKVWQQVEHELALISELKYEAYFLTVHDIVRFARSREILCQGRGAAANSAVCYCLGITCVDPSRINVLFERFVSKERNEPPDIDIDFEHERREEVIQYIYAKYGRDRAALTAEVISYRGRSAIRDVGKAMGLSLDCVDALAKTLGWWERGEIHEFRLRELGLDPNDRTLRQVLTLANQIYGFPRHLSQHVGGFVITRGALCESVPIENAAMADRTVIEWDKDDIDAMGMLKVDCLGLGMLTCIRKAMALINQGVEVARPQADTSSHAPLELHSIPAEDPTVYDMMCKADTIGVFQIESRAQMSMLPRLRPRCFYDLVIEVAIVRPGPIQGNMVHPYLRRRNGEEAVTYPDDAVRAVLGRTLGVPLFQEQAMALAIVAAGFTPGEADQLRRAMAAWKRKGDLIYRFGQKIVDGMIARGYGRDFAERCFEQIKGLQRVRLSRVARRELRAARVRVCVAEEAPSRGVRGGPAQQPAHGLLRPGTDRARCARAWRHGAGGRRQPQRLGLHARRAADDAAWHAPGQVDARRGGSRDRRVACFAGRVREHPATASAVRHERGCAAGAGAGGRVRVDGDGSPARALDDPVDA